MPGPVLDWNANNAKYHPYWRNKFVTGTNPGLLFSLWRTPERIVLGLFNHGKDWATDDKLRMGLWQPGDRILLSTDNTGNTALLSGANQQSDYMRNR